MTSVTPALAALDALQQRLDLATMEFEDARFAVANHNEQVLRGRMNAHLVQAIHALKMLVAQEEAISEALKQTEALHALASQNFPDEVGTQLKELDAWVVPLNEHLCKALEDLRNVRQIKHTMADMYNRRVPNASS